MKNKNSTHRQKDRQTKNINSFATKTLIQGNIWRDQRKFVVRTLR